MIIGQHKTPDRNRGTTAYNGSYDRKVDLIGRQFGLLTVITRGENGWQGLPQWICDCVCGNRTLVLGHNLWYGRTRSCGEHGYPRTHGMSKMPEYKSYQSAKDRCENPNNEDYVNYGARGIQFLYNSFEEFFQDLGVCPPGKTLDRFPDNDGNYEPGNCRWATPEEQANNKRNNILLTAFGRTQTLAMWTRETGIYRQILECRLTNGWSAERALSQPARKYSRKTTDKQVDTAGDLYHEEPRS